MLRSIILSFICLLGGACSQAMAQDTVNRNLSVSELFALAEQTQQMKISRTTVELAADRKSIVETLKLPSLTTGMTFTYIGNATIFDKDFSFAKSAAIPHFGNTFSVQSSELVFKGGLVKYSIEKAELDKQIAELSFEKNRADIKMLLVGRYLDLYKLYNQRAAFNRNIVLTKLRLRNIEKMRMEGMVTKNDLVRSELQLSNLDLAVQEIDNNISIINGQLVTITGLPANSIIIPDSSILSSTLSQKDYQASLAYAYEQFPDLKIAVLQSRIAEKNLQITKTDRLPAINLIAANNLTRPITSSVPPLNMYGNGWFAGINVGFNISFFFTSKKSENVSRTAVLLQKQITELQRENVQVEVRTAYIKHNESLNRIPVLQQALSQANENFRVVERKYLNGLALITEVVDASNAKLDTELQLANGQINIVYTWYLLQRAIGSL